METAYVTVVEESGVKEILVTGKRAKYLTAHIPGVIEVLKQDKGFAARFYYRGSRVEHIIKEPNTVYKFYKNLYNMLEYTEEKLTGSPVV